ncbi:mitochondrial 54S ribosomal protein mL49 NDAI_0I00360 [Naumovozyma dairenensis CBS 421]|uniref:Large ribosomal subunit protein mL49 n=1 Tax=Naumovozyma dairenensis (strain ATCC 10597 / BCRC 20456 / CBS 421 / NBRC 0211 / NRRL Y-12639) TaxID=1071378 RepID=G0WFP4_NAUDC|nr:hypothetical protein NDAI_0I00360 [Naumovozyma dairenensis CBS 421]CCD26605.1 hypothetical protein NDAI_0I00360 [Naumovozyma dairenensis CBS 421]
MLKATLKNRLISNGFIPARWYTLATTVSNPENVSIQTQTPILNNTPLNKDDTIEEVLRNYNFPKLNEIKSEDVLGNNRFGTKTYFIRRSTTGNLPVYTDYKGGGNKIITEVRKIEGDIIQLRNDLQEKLPQINKKNWSIVMQSKKIIIKGNFSRDIKKVLSASF